MRTDLRDILFGRGLSCVCLLFAACDVDIHHSVGGFDWLFCAFGIREAHGAHELARNRADVSGSDRNQIRTFSLLFHSRVTLDVRKVCEACVEFLHSLSIGSGGNGVWIDEEYGWVDLDWLKVGKNPAVVSEAFLLFHNVARFSNWMRNAFRELFC
jgi:hypothetical protein